MNKRYDVAIAGGGPAGAMAALGLARLEKDVVLLEASRFEGMPIGETVAPPMTNLLKKQGLWKYFANDGHLPNWGNRSAWGSSAVETAAYIFNPYGSGWHLDRNRFDKMLFEAAAIEGAACLAGHRVIRVSHNGNFNLHIIDDVGREHCIHADFFIDATGRGAHLGRSLGGKRTSCCPLLAHCAVYSRHGDHHAPEEMLVETAREGWWYSTPTPDGKLVVVYFTDAEGSRRLSRNGWESTIESAPLTSAIVRRRHLAGEPRIVSAGSHLLHKTDWDIPWLSCGDALMAVDPLSSQGIQHAMDTGLSAAEAAAAWLSGDSSPAQTMIRTSAESYTRYIGLRDAYYAMEKRWPDTGFWKKQIGSHCQVPG